MYCELLIVVEIKLFVLSGICYTYKYGYISRAW